MLPQVVLELRKVGNQVVFYYLVLTSSLGKEFGSNEWDQVVLAASSNGTLLCLATRCCIQMSAWHRRVLEPMRAWHKGVLALSSVGNKQCCRQRVLSAPRNAGTEAVQALRECWQSSPSQGVVSGLGSASVSLGYQKQCWHRRSVGHQ